MLARDNLDAEPDEGLETPRTWELVYRTGSPTSEAALHFVESRLNAVSAAQLDAQLKQLGVTAVLEAPTKRRAIEFTGAPIFSLAALIPLVLVLMTVTGAVYPAIDLTAGERERGTLEMLIAAPVPRLGLLLAKYAAVLTVALLTALVNLGCDDDHGPQHGPGRRRCSGRRLVADGDRQGAVAVGTVCGVLFGDPACPHQLRAELQGSAGVHHSADAVVPGAGRAVLDAEPRVHAAGWP